jgi:hypothetical protein
MKSAIFILSLAVIVLFFLNIFDEMDNSKAIKQKNDSIVLLKKQYTDFKADMPYVDYYSQGIVVEVGINGSYTIEWGQPTCGFYAITGLYADMNNEAMDLCRLQVDGGEWCPDLGDHVYIATWEYPWKPFQYKH